MKAASLDLGTNTFRLLIAEVMDGNSLKPILIKREITRLGGGSGNRPGSVPFIQKDALQRARKALRKFRNVIDKYKLKRIDAVATHIVREASNRDEFVNLVRNELGCEIRVISPQEEAELALRGVLMVLGKHATILLLDIGGGSSEFILSHDRKITAMISTDLGVVSLTERFLRKDPPGKEDLKELHNYIEKRLKEVYTGLNKNVMGATLSGTAGTATTLAMMDMGVGEYRPDKINGYILTYEAVSALYRKLAGITAKERLAFPGLERGREDVIVAGALLIAISMEVFRCQTMTVSDAGILEGILLNGESRPA